MRPNLDQIREALCGRMPCSRFAPSVTGYLHLGHLVNAVYVWGLTRALGGKIILRLEDHDRGRFRQEYEDAILEDLERIGLEWDVPEKPLSKPSDYRQSDCQMHYENAVELLRSRTQVYACACSRRIIEDRTGPSREFQELRYDGFCRDKNLEMGPDLTLRLALPEGDVEFRDELLGLQVQNPQQQCGDLPLIDKQGNWTYQFCVVVDDLRHGVNLVIRGEDILTSTGRQLQLMELLGEETRPVYVHHPLLVDPSGRKLSKSDFSAPIHEMLQFGIKPEKLLGMAAQRAGLTQTDDPISPAALPALFQ